MNWDALLFIFSLLDGAALLFLAVYFIITLSDLECDYINATQCCSRLNVWIIPEIIAHGFLVICFLSSFHWVIFLINAPLTTWQIYRYLTMPSGNIGIYDPTEIHNRQQLKSHMKEAMAKLGFHLLCFFIYLYCMVVALIRGESSTVS